ncbi:protein of unknown function [Candidatus Filomicrobium marinum]|uniref:Uncharacterized protein n=1 Tax=Candidatus Filomicrobium marinum TaxID=1608628 RepID=A0A0D6JDQ1_9HYPH|nr:protein of unknown function [Candidatus Filomicrobium marinum]CPR17287.1 protein of unknown function [Candidatus Filomicrobium marinum]
MIYTEYCYAWGESGPALGRQQRPLHIPDQSLRAVQGEMHARSFPFPQSFPNRPERRRRCLVRSAAIGCSVFCRDGRRLWACRAYQNPAGASRRCCRPCRRPCVA